MTITEDQLINEILKDNIYQEIRNNLSTIYIFCHRIYDLCITSNKHIDLIINNYTNIIRLKDYTSSIELIIVKLFKFNNEIINDILSYHTKKNKRIIDLDDEILLNDDAVDEDEIILSTINFKISVLMKYLDDMMFHVREYNAYIVHLFHKNDKEKIFNRFTKQLLISDYNIVHKLIIDYNDCKCLLYYNKKLTCSYINSLS